MPDRPCTEDKVLEVVIGCDCDPDRPQYGGVRYDSRQPLKWQGVREGMPRAGEIAERIRDDYGNYAKLTCCIRADAQMEEIYGNWAWPYGEFAELWARLEGRGDEIAWHPHLWRWSDDQRCWYQETEDETWMWDCLRQGYAALAERVRQTLTTSRMGWEFHDNLTMHRLTDLGVRVDFSAVPGRYTPGGLVDNTGGIFHGRVDWRGTGEDPYRPAVADYRRPAQTGEETLDIIEVPLSTFRSALLGIAVSMRQAAKALARARLDRVTDLFRGGQSRVKAYITVHPVVFSRLVAAKARQARQRGYSLLVTAFHADELLAERGSATATYSLKHFEANLKLIRRLAAEHDLQLRFATCRELSFTQLPSLTQQR